MRVRCNAGWTVTNMVGRLPGYPREVWYNPASITNILSLSDVTKYFCVHFDSGVAPSFIVEKPDGTERRFNQTLAGLYYHDTAGSHECDASAVALITTVASKRSKYTKRMYHQATLAHKLQKMISYPST